MNNTFHSYSITLSTFVGGTPHKVKVSDCHVEVMEGSNGALGIWRKDPDSDYEAMRLEAAYAPGQWLSFEIITA